MFRSYQPQDEELKELQMPKAKPVEGLYTALITGAHIQLSTNLECQWTSHESVVPQPDLRYGDVLYWHPMNLGSTAAGANMSHWWRQEGIWPVLLPGTGR